MFWRKMGPLMDAIAGSTTLRATGVFVQVVEQGGIIRPISTSSSAPRTKKGPVSGLGQVATFRCGRPPKRPIVPGDHVTVFRGQNRIVESDRVVEGPGRKQVARQLRRLRAGQRGILWIVPDVRQRTGVHSRARLAPPVSVEG